MEVSSIHAVRTEHAHVQVPKSETHIGNGPGRTGSGYSPRLREGTDQAKKIRQRLKTVQEQAAAQVGQLTAAEKKLSAAIEASQTAAPRSDDREDPFRDVLEAFGKLGQSGQEAIVQYLKTQAERANGAGL